MSGTSLVVQWLRLHASTAVGAGSIPGQGTKIPHATQHGQTKKEKEKEKRYIGLLSPRTSECDLIWKQGLYRDNRVKMRSLGHALIQQNCVLTERGNLDPDGRAQQEGDVKRGESHEKKAEIGVMGSQAKELQKLERGLEHIPA